PVDHQLLQKQQSDSAAVVQFVQGFYDWYTSIVGTHPFPDEWAVLSAGTRFITGDLASELRADSVALEHPRPSGQTLNFDAFLDSQDPCWRYRVTDVRSGAGKFMVTVSAVCPPQRQQYQSKRPVLEVVSQDGRWRIANVFYEKGDLKSLLCGFANADTIP